RPIFNALSFPGQMLRRPPDRRTLPLVLVGAAIHPNAAVIGLNIASIVVSPILLLAGGVVIIAESTTRQPNNSSRIHLGNPPSPTFVPSSFSRARGFEPPSCRKSRRNFFITMVME